MTFKNAIPLSKKSREQKARGSFFTYNHQSSVTTFFDLLNP